MPIILQNMSEILNRIDPYAYDFVPLGNWYCEQGGRENCEYFPQIKARGSFEIPSLFELIQPLPDSVRDIPTKDYVFVDA